MDYRVAEVLIDYGIDVEVADAKDAGSGEIKVLCPMHEDSTPSFFINMNSGKGFCHVCRKGLSLEQFISRSKKISLADIEKKLNRDYHKSSDKVINRAIMEDAHINLMSAQPDPAAEKARQLLMEALTARGINRDSLLKRKLGMLNRRIAIPILNEEDYLVNIRFHAPSEIERSDKAGKVINMKGQGTPVRLYPFDQLKFDEIMICGGELKAIAAAQELNEHGIGAVCATAGEGNWPAALNDHFYAKKVYVCLDIDKAGKEAADLICRQVLSKAEWVGRVDLNLDEEKYPKGDVNDYIAEGKSLFEALENILDYRTLITLETELNTKEIESVDLKSAVKAENVGHRLKFRAVPSAMDTSPFALPQRVNIKCAQDYKGCHRCGVMKRASQEFKIPSEAPQLLEMIGSDKLDGPIRKAAEIPSGCKVSTLEVISNYNAEDVRVSPELDLQRRDEGRIVTQAVCIGEGLQQHTTYEMTGSLYPHPHTQQLCLVVSNYQPVEDALSTYSPTNESALVMFRPKEWTFKALQAKLNTIYQDLEANVTRIFQRRRLHLAVDLAYHSPLWLDVNKKRIKGWTEVLVVGDSEQGKSETTNCLMAHYKLGEKVECKSASVAGLLGGLENFNKRWFVSWGMIPTHDKRLIVLEELKGLEKEAFAKLTDMRSSGYAEITKIEKRKAYARCRLLALSNPRGARTLDSFNYGVDAIVNLIGNLEDVRRFDYFLNVSRRDVDIDVVQSMKEDVPHRFTSTLCHELILWAWSVDKVIFEDEEDLMRQSRELCKQYVDEIPILGRGSGHQKVARLASALAARTFSYNDERELVVRKCHVEYICWLLQETYDDPNFALNDYSAAKKEYVDQYDEELVLKTLLNVPNNKLLVSHLRSTDVINPRVLEPVLGADHDGVRLFLSQLLSANAIRGYRENSYLKNSSFTKSLHEFSKKKDNFNSPLKLTEEDLDF